MILDFFPENALGDGPKNSRIRVKMYLVHRTIHEHNIQRQDFERLCSNHTIKQYDVEYENTRKRLNGQPGTDTLQFMNKKIKLELGDTLKLNKAAGKI